MDGNEVKDEQTFSHNTEMHTCMFQALCWVHQPSSARVHYQMWNGIHGCQWDLGGLCHHREELCCQAPHWVWPYPLHAQTQWVVSCFRTADELFIARVRGTVVVIVVAKQLSLMMLDICLWIKGHKIWVVNILYHVCSDLRLQQQFYQSGFVILFPFYQAM